MISSVKAIVFVVFVSRLDFAICGCPKPFHDYNNACYYFESRPATRISADTALTTCVALGGYLVNINAQPEHDYMVHVLSTVNSNVDGYWIGAIFNGQQWVWQKLSGGILAPLRMDYTNWAVGEPASGRWVQNRWVPYRHSAINAVNPYRWHAQNTLTRNRMGFICERDWQ